MAFPSSFLVAVFVGSRLDWSICGTSFRSGRTTSWRLTPCVTPLSAWAEPSEGKPTTAWWFLQTRWAILPLPGVNVSVCRDRSCCGFCSAAIRPCGQTGEASSLDSGAHQRRQPEPHRGRGGPAVQALPASDGSAVQTGTTKIRLQEMELNPDIKLLWATTKSFKIKCQNLNYFKEFYSLEQVFIHF